MKKLAIRFAIYIVFIVYLLADAYVFKGPMYHLMLLGQDEIEAALPEGEKPVAKIYSTVITRDDIRALLAEKYLAEDLESAIMYRILYLRELNHRINDELMYYNAKYFRKEIKEKTGRDNLEREELKELFLALQWEKRGEEFDSIDEFRERLIEIYKVQAGDAYEVLDLEAAAMRPESEDFSQSAAKQNGQ